MTKKTILTIALLISLAGLSFYFNRWRFTSQPLQVSHRSMQPRGIFLNPKRRDTAVNPVLFLLNQEVRLTSVKVVLADDLATNQFPFALWNLVSDSNSIPVKDFYYGLNIQGMKPKVKGSPPELLQPNVKYHLFIEAGPLKADHEFTPEPRSRSR